MFGQNAQVGANESVSEVVVVHGDVVVDGEVRDTVVVVGGNLKVTGKIRGTVVVVLGNLEAGSSAVFKRPAVVVGGSASDPDSRLRPDSLILSLDRVPAVKGMVSWVTHGLLYLRPLPPDVRWAWAFPSAFLLLYLLMSLVLAGPADACVRALEQRPISSYMVGLLGLLVVLLAMPLMLVLGAVVVGLLAVLALFLAVLFGRMAVVRFVGLQVGRQLGIEVLQRPLVSLVVGTGLMCLVYMIPVIGLAVWAGIFPLAVGSLLMAGFTAVRPSRKAPPLAPSPGPAEEPPLPPPLPQDLMAGPPAGFFIRLVGTCIDLILVGCLIKLFHLPPRAGWLVWIGYHVAMWSWRGATLGGRAVGTQVVELDGKPVDLPVALVRSLAAFLSAIPLCLGFFWSAWDTRKQSWHDKLAGTLVVRRRR
jgi:uncharacterized RDD family membrane protein YckC